MSVKNDSESVHLVVVVFFGCSLANVARYLQNVHNQVTWHIERSVCVCV